MLTDRGWLETILALVYFAILEALSWETSQFPPCILVSNEAGGENQSGNQACATMHEAIFRFADFIWDNASHDNILAFGTICIAVFTYVLYRATNKLWDAGERQLAHFEAASKRELRAYVFLGYSPLNFSNRQAGFILKMTNVGKMPGNIKEVGYAFLARNSLPSRRNDADWTWETMEWDWVIPADGQRDIKGLESPIGDHIFVAFIRYNDLFAKETHTSWMGMHIRPDATPENRTARAGGDIWNDWD
jgi:hypothetical protein